jgi:hypothetical protein
MEISGKRDVTEKGRTKLESSELGKDILDTQIT